MFSIGFVVSIHAFFSWFWKIPYNSLVCLLYNNDAVVKVNFSILKIAVNINNVSDADFFFCFHILIVINNLSRVVAVSLSFNLVETFHFTRCKEEFCLSSSASLHHTAFYCSSSPSSCLILEKSKSSPVPRLKMSSTSRQVVSKCVVASYDSEINTCDWSPLSVGS